MNFSEPKPHRGKPRKNQVLEFTNSQKILDLSATQEIVPEEPILQSDDESLSDDFAIEVEMQFKEEISEWLTEYAPKLFNLAAKQWLTGKEKKRKLSKIESSETSHQSTPRKKQKRSS